MIDRREFLEAAMAAAVASRAGVLFAERQTGVLGANDRIRVGLIGCGNRGNQVATDWMKHKDSVFTAACDVAQGRLEKTAARLGQTQNNTVETYEDYRRILDRKDVDAVLIATPDHWHGPMTVEACAAGKDVYCREAGLQRDRARAEDARGRAQVQRASCRSACSSEAGTTSRKRPGCFTTATSATVVNHCQMCPPGGGGSAAAAARRAGRQRSAASAAASTGKCSRAPRSASRSCRAGETGAAGTTTAAATSPTGACTSPTSCTGS